MVKHRGPAGRLAGMALIGLGATTLGACNWTAFDDLASETWVERVDGPGGTRQFGAVLGALPATTGTPATAGANLVALGRADVSVTLLAYDRDGKKTTRFLGVSTLPQGLAFDTFPPRPPFAVDTATRRFAFGGVSGNAESGQGFVVVFDGDLPETQVGVPRTLALPGDTGTVARLRPGGLIFGNIPSAADVTNGFANRGDLGDLVVSRGTQLDVILDYEDAGRTTTDYPECTQTNTSDFDTAFGTGLADLTGDGVPEVIVAMAPMDGNQGVTGSEIRIYAPDGVVKAGQTVAAPGPCDAPIDTIPVAAFDGGYALLTTRFDPAATADDLVYSAPSINTVFVRLAGTTTSIPLTVPLTGSNFGYAMAAGDLDGDGAPELVVGAPRSDIDGTTDAGAVYIYKFDPVAKTFATISAEPLTVASPAASEQFGKSVAVAAWGATGQNILAVGAEDKLFTYFRTALYLDVRNGR